jgi:membrane-bound serine protease (ClpP class)
MARMARSRVAILIGLCLWPELPLAQSPRPPTDRPTAAVPTAVVTELDGIIHPIAAEYIDEAISEADASGADVVVIVLRTPGGLLDSTRDIVTRMIASRAPVVVFVGPSGARAASAGFILTIAADVAVMAPGTHVGAAHPVSGTGQPADTVTATKAAEDVAAYVRTLAEARKRNVELAAEAVMKSRAFTDTEALGASPSLIDFVAQDVPDLLRKLDGRTVRRFDGRSAVVRAGDAIIRTVTMSRRQRFLSTIAHPQIAYLLLTLGILGLTVEFWNPGAIAPGVAGGICLLLAFFALQVLPVNTTGVLLVVFGLALLLLELKVPSFGALGIGGTLSLVIGSVMMTRTVPGVSVPLRFVIPVALSVAGISLFLGRLALQAQRRSPVTGAGALIGLQGRARTPVTPGVAGQIDVRGEIWRAESAVSLHAGDLVRVTAVNGLTLLVEPAGAATRQGAD